MSLINLSVKHGQTQEEARANLEKAVHDVRGLFGPMIRRVDWAADRYRVRLEGVGFWAEMWVEPQDLHANGDIPLLGSLLGGPLAAGLTQAVRKNFPRAIN